MTDLYLQAILITTEAVDLLFADLPRKSFTNEHKFRGPLEF
jgi:hypothetical protein